MGAEPVSSVRSMTGRLRATHEPPDWYEDFCTRFRDPKGGRILANNEPIGDGHLTQKGYITIDMCAACNRWLGDTLESPVENRHLLMQLVSAAPSLEELTPVQQRVAALWLAKTGMLWDAAIFFRQQTLPTLRHFRQTGELPARVRVWIGQLAPEVVEGPTPQNLKPKPELVECMSIPWGCWGESAQKHRLRTLITDDPRISDDWAVELPVELEGMFVQVWPPHERVIDWPPPVIIDRPANDALNSVLRVRDWPFDGASE